MKCTLKDESAPYLDVTLTRDFLGNITRRQEPAQSPAPAIDYTYTFDGMNRLSSGEDETQTYDELSNLVAKGTNTYTYQDPDDEGGDQMRLASFNDGTQHDYTYDANGNPVSVSNKFTSLEYDNLNLLRQIVHSQTDDYRYNRAGLRVKKTEDSGGTWKTTYTLFDGVNPLMQEVYDSSGRIQVTFNIIVNGQILAQYKRVYPSTDSVVYFYLDYLSSRRVVLDSSGTAIDRYRYSAWGEATQDTGSDDYRSFTGKDYDATGFIYFNARYYDPVTGRFLTEDPAMKGISWYGYCENNPLIYVDLMGLQENKSIDTVSIKKEEFYMSYEQYKKNYNPILTSDISASNIHILNIADQPNNEPPDIEEEFLISKGYKNIEDYEELVDLIAKKANEPQIIIFAGAHSWIGIHGLISSSKLGKTMADRNVKLHKDTIVYMLDCGQGGIKNRKSWSEQMGISIENIYGVEGFSNPETTAIMLRQIIEAMETGNPANIEAYIHRLYLAKRSHDYWYRVSIKIDQILGIRDELGRIIR